MRRFQVCLLVLAVAGIGTLALKDSIAQTRSAADGGCPVAVCDVVQVFNSYKRAVDLTDQLNQRRDKIKQEDTERTKAIDAITQELEGLKPDSPAYEERMNEAQRLSIDRAAWLKFQEQLAMREHHRLTKDMYQEILAMVAKIAGDDGYQIVLYREREDQAAGTTTTEDLLRVIERRKVLYNSPAVDITEQVLSRLNQAYTPSPAR